ncbi:MAG: aerotolerance regulator BatA, partial [Ignavibacteria bacterium]|nr:aerotolerance regulator BatA [Ignavibacteria bacterium]
VEIDEPLMKEIAQTTGGEYFRATDNKKLKEIYETIDKLEKTKVEITSYRNAKELYYSWLGGGVIILLLELGLSRTVLRKLP